jgi:hypothetical protein
LPYCSYCLPNGLYELYLDDSLYYQNTHRHGYVTFYSITGGGTQNITLTGTTNSSQLFDVGGVQKGVQDDDEIDKKNEDDDSNLLSNEGVLAGIIIGAVILGAIVLGGIW